MPGELIAIPCVDFPQANFVCPVNPAEPHKRPDRAYLSKDAIVKCFLPTASQRAALELGAPIWLCEHRTSEGRVINLQTVSPFLPAEKYE